MERKVFSVLNRVGVPCNIRGRLYIESALGIVDKNRIVSVTKELYPQIARLHNTTSSCVERAIRHAIEVCFLNTDPDVLYDFFGNSISFKKGKVTNTEFIYGLKKIY